MEGFRTLVGILLLSTTSCVQERGCVIPNVLQNYERNGKVVQANTYIDRCPYGDLDSVIIGYFGKNEPLYLGRESPLFKEYEEKFKETYPYYVRCWMERREAESGIQHER